MKYLKKIYTLIKKGDFITLFRKTVQFIAAKIWFYISVKKDKKIGSRKLTDTIPTKYEKLGAYDTQSTDYACLNKIFHDKPLADDDVFVDVGCGEGRVLTYLYLKGFKGKIIGVELDPDIAKTAADRTSDCQNIEVKCSNILECTDVLKTASVYYLFNPFCGKILLQLVEKIEENATQPVKIYYCNDLYKRVLVGRSDWSIIREGKIKRLHATTMSYSVHLFSPPQKWLYSKTTNNNKKSIKIFKKVLEKYR